MPRGWFIAGSFSDFEGGWDWPIISFAQMLYLHLNCAVRIGIGFWKSSHCTRRRQTWIESHRRVKGTGCHSGHRIIRFRFYTRGSARCPLPSCLPYLVRVEIRPVFSGVVGGSVRISCRMVARTQPFAAARFFSSAQTHCFTSSAGHPMIRAPGRLGFGKVPLRT